jgi:hypothetical protein
MGRLGSRAAAPEINMKATSRAEVVKALQDSFDFGTAALMAQTDATMVQLVANTSRAVKTRARNVERKM